MCSEFWKSDWKPTMNARVQVNQYYITENCNMKKQREISALLRRLRA